MNRPYITLIERVTSLSLTSLDNAANRPGTHHSRWNDLKRTHCWEQSTKGSVASIRHRPGPQEMNLVKSTAKILHRCHIGPRSAWRLSCTSSPCDVSVTYLNATQTSRKQSASSCAHTFLCKQQFDSAKRNVTWHVFSMRVPLTMAIGIAFVFVTFSPRGEI